LNLSTAYYSAKGGRNVNEDSVSVAECNGGAVGVVADGLGGEGFGDIASKLTVKTLIKKLASEPVSASVLRSVISYTNKEVLSNHTDSNKMKSTVAVLYIDNSKVLATHVGDTRIYQFRDSAVIYQSIDHSVSQMAVNAGEITTDEIRGHADRNKLLCALGTWDNPNPEVITLSAKPGDAFLLCTDGFWELITESEMINFLKNSTTAETWLTQMRETVDSRVNPSSDNHTALAILII